MYVHRYARITIAILIVFVAGCKDAKTNTITLQTTTSPRDSGLLDVLLPKFRAQTGIDVKVIAVGSGQALENSRRGDGDIVVAHSPEAEQKFMDDGFGVSRKPLMENDFIIVGPVGDPAKVKGMPSTADAFRTISEAEAVFVSRADESGTHVKEKSFWKAAEIDPTSKGVGGDWYIKAGVGMADALRMADEKQAYILTDKATYLAQKDKLKLVPLVEGDPMLINLYSVIVVSSKKHPALHETEATKLADFLTSPEAKKLIDEFGKAKFGESLFRAAK